MKKTSFVVVAIYLFTTFGYITPLATRRFVPPAAPSYLFCRNPLDAATVATCSFKDNANNETGFVVETKVGFNGTYTTALTPSATSDPHVTFQLTGLTPETVYYVRVKAVNGDGDSAYLKEKFIVTQSPATPDAPSGLSASALNYNYVRLSWVDNSWNEYEWKVERKTGAVGTYSEIATVPANVTSYDDQSVVASTQYYYRVRARWRSVMESSTVAGLPTAAAGAFSVRFVTDAANSTDCTTGGGSTINKCTSNGTTWLDWTLNSGPPVPEAHSAYATETSVTTSSDTANTSTSWITSHGTSASGSEGTKPLGGRILTGAQPIEVTELCRYKATGNDEEHALYIETYVTSGRGTTLATVTQTAGEVSAAPVGMLCKAISPKVTLAPFTQYIVGGDETSTDNHLGHGNDITAYGANSGIAEDAIYYNGNRWVDSTIGTNHFWGHSFKYDLVAAPQSSNPPTNLRIGTIYPDKIQVLWDSSATDHTGFEVDRCQGAGCTSWSTVQTTGATAKEHTSTSLSASTTYRYRVRSTIGGGTDSANSSILDVTTRASNNFYVNTGGQLTTVLSSVTAGGLIEVEAGSTHTAPPGDSFNLSADGTAGNRITMRSTAHASLPSGRLSPDMAGSLFTVVAGSSEGLDISGDYWTVTGARVTSSRTQGSAVAVSMAGTGNILDKSYLHPYHHESYWWKRNMPVGVALNGTRNAVLNSYIYGFYSDEEDNAPSATEAIKSNDLNDGLVYNNTLNAGFVTYFGGGEGSSAVIDYWSTVSEQGTGPSGTVTSFKVAGITNLKVGMVISVGQGSGGWGTGDQYGAACRVASINTSTNLITCDEHLKRDPQNPPGNPGADPGTANVGDVVRWRSTRARDIKFLANTIYVAPWNTDDNLAHQHGTKGYFEVKDTAQLILIGNRFDGFDQALTLTSGNQNGNNVSHNVQDVLVKSNVFESYSAIAGIVLRDPYKRSYGPTNWRFENNLAFIGYRNRQTENPGTFTAANSPGNYRERETHYGLEWVHNTLMWATTAEWPGINTGVSAMRVVNEVNPATEGIYGLEVKDNIFSHQSNGFQCSNNSNVECFFNAVFANNLVANVQGVSTAQWTADYGASGHITPIPTDKASLGMYDVDDYTPHGYRLNPAVSLYEGTASDGTDPGVNIDTLLAALEMDLPADYTSPTGAITSPLGGATLTALTGTQNITVSASDASGIASVEIVVDTTPVCVDTSAPYECAVNFGVLTPGLHTIRATITDNSTLRLPYTAEYEIVQSGEGSGGAPGSRVRGGVRGRGGVRIQ